MFNYTLILFLIKAIETKKVRPKITIGYPGIPEPELARVVLRDISLIISSNSMDIETFELSSTPLSSYSTEVDIFIPNTLALKEFVLGV